MFSKGLSTVDVRILLIEDDQDLAEAVCLQLKAYGYEVDHAPEGEVGLNLALENDYSVVLLDVMLPKLDGLEVCKRIRERKKTLPLIMITSRTEQHDKIIGLELGADDYVTKPFGISELLARVRAQIRRVEAYKETLETGVGGERIIGRFGPLTIDYSKRRVEVDGNAVDLTQLEFDLLAYLAKRSGVPVSRKELLSEVWHADYSNAKQAINSLVKRLREKIEVDPESPRFIKTVRGVGYCFTDEFEV